MGTLSHGIYYQDWLSQSLFAPLIPLGLLEAGRISIALIIHSLDRRGFLSPALSAWLIAPYKCTFQTGSKQLSKNYRSSRKCPHRDQFKRFRYVLPGYSLVKLLTLVPIGRGNPAPTKTVAMEHPLSLTD